jgi:hypothetical protein
MVSYWTSLRPHNRLLMKLDHYGVRNNTLSWIQDFLSDRTQTIVLEGNSSSTNPVASGVPQGTVLGPLFFLVYINDMPGYARSQTRLFADDCLMYRKVSSTSDCTQLQEDLDNLINLWNSRCNRICWWRISYQYNSLGTVWQEILNPWESVVSYSIMIKFH